MQLQIGKYRNNIAFIKSYMLTHGTSDLGRMVAELAANTGVPCIAVAQYLIELHGTTPELETTKERLMKFYGITEVVE